MFVQFTMTTTKRGPKQFATHRNRNKIKMTFTGKGMFSVCCCHINGGICDLVSLKSDEDFVLFPRFV